MRASRHNGRSGKHGVYNPKHNDRRFNVQHSEHIDPERKKENLYWDCYHGISKDGKLAEMTFEQVEENSMRKSLQILSKDRMPAI